MGDATGVARTGCADNDDAVEYCADEGRATGGVEGQAAGWRARLAVILSARHERSRDCPEMGDARMRGWKVGVVVGMLRPVMEFVEVPTAGTDFKSSRPHDELTHRPAESVNEAIPPMGSLRSYCGSGS